MKPIAALIFVFAAACTGGGAGGPSISTPDVHRSAAMTCSPSAGDSNGPDECLADGDCANGGVCSCAGTTFEYAHETRNICVVAQCHVDADCGTTLCSPSVNDCGTFYGVQGYYCRTADDTCGRDSDCVQNGQPGYCYFAPEVGHWTCGFSFCAG